MRHFVSILFDAQLVVIGLPTNPTDARELARLLARYDWNADLFFYDSLFVFMGSGESDLAAFRGANIMDWNGAQQLPLSYLFSVPFARRICPSYPNSARVFHFDCSTLNCRGSDFAELPP